MASANVRVSTRRRRVPVGVWGLLLIVPSLFLLVSAATAWMAAARNSARTVVSYSDFARNPPKSGWYTITGALVDVRKSVYWEENGVCIDVYAPLQPSRGHQESAPDIYVEIDDPSVLSAFQDMKYAQRDGGEAGAARFVAQHMDTFVQRRSVSGLVSFGHRDPIGEWAKAGLDAANVTYIADGWRPNPVFGYAGTAIGLFMTLLCVWLLAKQTSDGRRSR